MPVSHLRLSIASATNNAQPSRSFFHEFAVCIDRLLKACVGCFTREETVKECPARCERRVNLSINADCISEHSAQFKLRILHVCNELLITGLAYIWPLQPCFMAF